MKRFVMLISFLIICLCSKFVLAASISGTVYHVDGITPITGDNEIYVEIYTHDWPDNYLEQVQVSPISGTYQINSLAAGDYDLRIHAKNYIDEFWASPTSVYYRYEAGTITIHSDDNITGINFQLDPGTAVSGTVFRTDGTTPINDAEVYGFKDRTDKMWDFIAYHGEDGTYSFRLPEGKYYFSAGNPEKYLTEFWAETQSVLNEMNAEPVYVYQGQDVTGIDFQLEMAVFIHGTIYNSGTNLPITGDRFISIGAVHDSPCEPQGDNFGGWINEYDGTYSIALEPGSYYLIANANNYIDEWWGQPQSVYSCNQAVQITVSPDSPPANYDFYLEPGAVISGKVFERDGVTPYTHHEMVFVNAVSQEPCEYNNNPTFDLFWASQVDPQTGEYYVHVPTGTYYFELATGDWYSSQWWSLPRSVPIEQCSQARSLSVVAGNTYPDINFQVDGNSNVYDDFSFSSIDPAKWRDLEKVRAPSGGVLMSGIRGEAKPPTFEDKSKFKNMLPFVNANDINTIEADVVYLEGYNSDPAVKIGATIEGYFYQAGGGDVYAYIGLGKGDYDTPRAACRVITPSDETKNLYHYFDMGIHAGEPYHLKISYDPDANEFSFTITDQNGNSESINWTASQPSGPPVNSFKSLTTLLIGPEGTGVSSIFATFDNVRINNQEEIYDDFDGALLDPAKWEKLDRVRAIRDDKLVLSRHLVDGRKKTQAAIVEENVQDATYFGADISFSPGAIATNEASAVAFLGGFFYNDTYDMDYNDVEGNIGVSIGLLYDQNNGYRLGYKTKRCNNADCTDYTESRHGFATHLEPGQEYRVSIELKEGSLFFRCNNEVVEQEITTSIYSPSVKDWKVGVVADGNGNGEAYVRAEFDNVAITAPEFDPFAWDLDFDGDVDGMDIYNAASDQYGINPVTVQEIAMAFGRVVP